MPVIGLRRLSRETRDVVKEMEDTGEPVIVARRGEPVAVLLPATPERLADAAMAISPELRSGFDEADAELAEGKTRPFDEVMAEIRGESKLEEAPAESTQVEYQEIVANLGQGLVESVAPSVPIEFREQSQALNTKLVEELVESGLDDAVLRAQTMNETLISLAGGLDQRSARRYITLLKRLLAAKNSTDEAAAVSRRLLAAKFWSEAEAESASEAAVEAAEAPQELA